MWHVAYGHHDSECGFVWLKDWNGIASDDDASCSFIEMAFFVVVFVFVFPISSSSSLSSAMTIQGAPSKKVLFV